MQRIVRVFCDDHGFEFACSLPDALSGTLDLNGGQREWLKERTQREDESEDQPWYLDDDGERLPPEVLFERSPWSIETATGRAKVLIRLLNYETGEAQFNMPDGYLGEWHRWMRQKSTDEPSY